MMTNIETFMLGYLSEDQWICALSELPNQTKEIIELIKIQEETYNFKFEAVRETYPKYWSDE